jgi:mortality factor 4-like protein 1
LTDKFIHSWDDWVPQDRLRKLTDDNRELANNLKRDLVQTQPTRTSAKPAGSSRKGKGQGSDLGSGRGSEERHSSVPAGGRGTKRGKDNDVEKVGSFYFLVFHLVISPNLSK